MPQVSSFATADGSGLSVREAINAILAALQSSSSGTAVPASPVKGQVWCNTSSTPYAMEVYDGANWWTIAYLESNGVWAIVEPQADLRYLKLAGGTLTGSLSGTTASFTAVTVNGVSVNSAALFTSGQVAPAQLGTGTPTSTTLLLGTGAWGTASFSILGGQVSNAQVPSSAVTQWQASLAIAWSQITGTKNADELQGYTVATSATASTIALRDGGGNLWATYFNQGSANNENPSVSQVLVTNGSDNYLRKASAAYLLEQLMLSGAVTLEADPGTTPSTGTPGSIIAYY